MWLAQRRTLAKSDWKESPWKPGTPGLIVRRGAQSGVSGSGADSGGNARSSATLAASAPIPAANGAASAAQVAGVAPPEVSESSVAREEFEDVARTGDAPLALRRRDTYPDEVWVLEQRTRRLAAIARTASGWSLTTASHRWSAALRRRRHRIGWHIEVTASGAQAPVLEYRPATLRAGGTLELADGRSYKLRRMARASDEWTLSAAGRDRLARISRRINPPSGSALAHGPTGLSPAAADEPDLTLLLAAACAAMAAHYEQPRTAGNLV